VSLGFERNNQVREEIEREIERERYLMNPDDQGGGEGKYLGPSPPEATGKFAFPLSVPRGGGAGVKVPKNGLRYAKF